MANAIPVNSKPKPEVLPEVKPEVLPEVKPETVAPESDVPPGKDHPTLGRWLPEYKCWRKDH